VNHALRTRPCLRLHMRERLWNVSNVSNRDKIRANPPSHPSEQSLHHGSTLEGLSFYPYSPTDAVAFERSDAIDRKATPLHLSSELPRGAGFLAAMVSEGSPAGVERTCALVERRADLAPPCNPNGQESDAKIGTPHDHPAA
jgi:hypothetical protein